MKKTISLLMVLALCLSLCACGGSNESADATKEPVETEAPENALLSKDELSALAVPYTREDYDKAITNKAYASSFVDNVYSFDGTVFTVMEDHAIVTFREETDTTIYVTDVSMLCAKVYLPIEELVNLEPNQRVLGIGKVTEVGANVDVGFETFPGSGIVFENAYLDTEFECTATLKGENHSYEGAYNIQVGDSSYLDLVYFADGVDLSGINTDSDEITFTAKIIDSNYHDAVIVK